MTILNELIEYANLCLNDIKISEYEDYISCKKHKNACERFLKDVQNAKNNEDFEYFWDEIEAQKIVKWFSYLRHSKGILAGKPIILTKWQKFILCQVYGWRYKKSNYRRFNKAFIEVARKNAKSQMESGVSLYEISYTSTKNHEVNEAYTAGVKRKQSKIIFDEAVLMLRRSPLRTKFKITRDKITHIKTGSYLEPLNKEDGKKGDGTCPALLVIDEFHQHSTTEFYDLFLGANTKESLLMIITTAGMDLTYPCFTQEYSYCSKLLDPNNDIENDNYLVDILEIDDLDNIEDKRNWNKANPIRCSYSDGVKKIDDEFKLAKEIPEKMVSFLTKCMNKWVQARENGYMNMAKWKACEIAKIPYDLKGKDVFVGFDMSAKIDLTSVSFIIPIMVDGIKKYVLFSHSFIPNEEKLRERTIRDKVPYNAWRLNGWLTVTNTEIVDQSQVMEYVINTCKANNWNIYQLCFDPANASKLMMDLQNEGNYEVVEVYQSHRSLNEATVGFREEVYQGNVIYEPNPLLNFAMSNAVTKTNNGLIKIDKDISIKRIDPVDATLAAFKLAYYYDVNINNNKDIDEWLDEKW